jgi:hypothetical protein
MGTRSRTKRERRVAAARAQSATARGRGAGSGRARSGAAAWLPWAVAVVVAALLVGTGAYLVLGRGGGAGPAPTASPVPSPSVGPLLAAAPSYPSNPPDVNGIRCETMEQVAYHIHAHLAVLVNRVERPIPEGIGIAPPRVEATPATGPFVSSGSCFYWLHAHTADGIIHIESPTQRKYTLGDWFAIWGQPLNANQVATATGPVIAYVNGRQFFDDPATIPLVNHVLIQLDVGGDSPPLPFKFPSGT